MNKGSANEGSANWGSASASEASGQCVIAVDVGNSAAKLLIEDAAGGNETRSFRIDQLDWAQAAVQCVTDHVSLNRLVIKPTHWRIASVHRNAAARLSTAISEATAEDEIRLVSQHDVPLAIDVEFPDRVGIDRLVSAYAALKFAKPPLVVVDAGSAVTVDWVDPAGTFCGGAILPGLRLQTTSLATGTDALPDLDWHDDRALAIPGRNTLQAIRLGVLTGIAAGIDRLVDAYCDASNAAETATVLVTGGDAAAISPHLRCSHRVEPNLVCRGLLKLPAKPSIPLTQPM